MQWIIQKPKLPSRFSEKFPKGAWHSIFGPKKKACVCHRINLSGQKRIHRKCVLARLLYDGFTVLSSIQGTSNFLQEGENNHTPEAVNFFSISFARFLGRSSFVYLFHLSFSLAFISYGIFLISFHVYCSTYRLEAEQFSEFFHSHSSQGLQPAGLFFTFGSLRSSGKNVSCRNLSRMKLAVLAESKSSVSRVGS